MIVAGRYIITVKNMWLIWQARLYWNPERTQKHLQRTTPVFLPHDSLLCQGRFS